MEIYPLLYFKTIAERGNLTRAAEQLMISPPALCNALKRLERDLGVPLFDRVGRNLLLNRYGEAYLPYAQKILALVHQGNDLMQQMQEVQQRQLMIADTTTVFASHLIGEFLRLHPQIRIHRTYINPAEGKIIDLAKDYDFAISSSNIIRQTDLHRISLRSGQAIVAIVNRENPIAARSSISMQELSEEPMITYIPGQPGRIMLERLFQQLQCAPAIVFEGNTPHTMMPALERDLGVFLQASHIARFNMPLYPNCVAVPVLDAAYHADTSLFWSGDRPLTKAGRLLCDFCQQYSRNNALEVTAQ